MINDALMMDPEENLAVAHRHRSGPDAAGGRATREPGPVDVRNEVLISP